MCNSRNDNIEHRDTFWAFDKHTGKCADQTGYCVCLGIRPWAIYAIDLLGCERVFSRHLFRFEVI